MTILNTTRTDPKKKSQWGVANKTTDSAIFYAWNGIFLFDDCSCLIISQSWSFLFFCLWDNNLFKLDRWDPATPRKNYMRAVMDALFTSVRVTKECQMKTHNFLSSFWKDTTFLWEIPSKLERNAFKNARERARVKVACDPKKRNGAVHTHRALHSMRVRT